MAKRKKPDPNAPKGFCPVCGKLVNLNADGVTKFHFNDATKRPCRGTHRMPNSEPVTPNSIKQILDRLCEE